MKIVKETDKYILIRYHEDRSDTSKETKFLCIGGPCAGLWRAALQIQNQGYVAYNAAYRLGIGYRGKKTPHSQVWIHDSYLTTASQNQAPF